MAIQEQSRYNETSRSMGVNEPIEHSVDPETEFLREDDYVAPLVNSIGQYFKEIGEVDLLTRKEEVRLCKSIEKGRIAIAILKNAQELGITQIKNVPSNKLPLVDNNKAAGIKEDSALQYLEEFGLAKDDITLVLYERTPKKKESIVSDDPSDSQDKELETIAQDEDYADLNDQSQVPEDDRKILLVKNIYVGLENIRATLNPQILTKAIEEGEKARQYLIEANLRWVVSIAKKHTYMYELLDIIQFGNIGLSIAANKFEWWKGYKFSTYSSNWIKQSIDRGKKDHGHTIRIPVHAQEEMFAIEKIRRNYFDTNGCEPTTQEIANILEWELVKVEQTTELFRTARGVASIDQEQIINGEVQENTLAGQIPSTEPGPHDEAEVNDFREIILSILGTLSEREAKVLILRLGLDDGGERTLDEVGVLFGVTRERIRQIQAKALEKLKNPNTKRLLTTNES